MFIPNWKTYLWDNWHLSPLIIRLTNRVSCTACNLSQHKEVEWPGGHFKNAYELLNLRALKIQCCIKIMFQYMGKIFQRYPLKFKTKYLTHILKYVYVIHRWKFKHPPLPPPPPPPIPQSLVLLHQSEAVPTISANGSAPWKESCTPIG